MNAAAINIMLVLQMLIIPADAVRINVAANVLMTAERNCLLMVNRFMCIKFSALTRFPVNADAPFGYYLLLYLEELIKPCQLEHGHYFFAHVPDGHFSLNLHLLLVYQEETKAG